MSEWKCLHEIENWRDKKIVNRYFPKDIFENGFMTDTRLIIIAMDFDKPVWKEVKNELPSYDDWFKENESIKVEEIYSVNCAIISIKYVLTRKELLRRYIKHLKNIVNEGLCGIWRIRYEKIQKKLLPIYDANDKVYISDSLYFASKEAAQQVIDHATPELLELYGVKNEEET